jgi:hypothetical protein
LTVNAFARTPPRDEGRKSINESKPADAPVDREELRARLRKMTDNELRHFGRTVRKKHSTNRGKTPHEESVIELEEASAEWKRRFTPSPKTPKLPELI